MHTADILVSQMRDNRKEKAKLLFLYFRLCVDVIHSFCHQFPFLKTYDLISLWFSNLVNNFNLLK